MNALHVSVTDYRRFEDELGLKTPYAMWNTVDGRLFERWMDLAYECDFDQVVFHIPREMDLDGAQISKGSKWPIDVQWRTGRAPERCERYESLFGDVITEGVASSWELIDRHWVAVTNRLAMLWLRVLPEFPELKIGKLSRIEPGVRLEAPYWIGSDCIIGRNAVIGPGTVISDGCVIGAGVILSSTYVGEQQYIADDARFDGYHLQDGVALHRKRRLAGLAIDPELLRSRKKQPRGDWWNVARR